jgi:hypothetical protein
MIAREIHIAPPGATTALNNLLRLVRPLLCLAGVAALVVAIRLGVYEYFHGDGRVLAWAWKVLHLG